MTSGRVDSLKNIKNKSFGASEVTTKDPEGTKRTVIVSKTDSLQKGQNL